MDKSWMDFWMLHEDVIAWQELPQEPNIENL